MQEGGSLKVGMPEAPGAKLALTVPPHEIVGRVRRKIAIRSSVMYHVEMQIITIQSTDIAVILSSHATIRSRA